jgi:hypothetical protein
MGRIAVGLSKLVCYPLWVYDVQLAAESWNRKWVSKTRRLKRSHLQYSDCTMRKLPNTFLPPKGLKEVMNDQNEIRTFQAFKTANGGVLHSTLSVPTQYNSQRREWRTLPSQ